MPFYDMRALEALCADLEMPPEAAGRCVSWAARPELQPCAKWIPQLVCPDTAETAEKELRKVCDRLDGDGIAELTVMLLAALETRVRYRERDVPDALFIPTMKCFSRFERECERWFGRICFNRGFWGWRQLCGNLYRLGELEFERVRLAEASAKLLNVPEGTEAISVHIPGDAHCRPEPLHEAYRECERFFGKTEPLAYCHTWLLSPLLRPALPDTSGIRAFADDYRLLEVNEQSNSGRLWLFGAPNLKDEELPETTSLQRYMKARLLAGGKTGDAFGLLDWQRIRA